MSRIPLRAFLVTILVAVVGIGLLTADSGPNHQTKQTPPVQLGTSGGNVNNISSAFCCSGTLGSLVTAGGTDYILSNNHILADTDTANIGDDISQPGLIDVGCRASNAQVVANFTKAVNLLAGKNVDAAVAEVVPGMVDANGAIIDVGVPASTPAAIDSTAINRGVAKSGRTTGLTCASIGSISTSVKVQYQRGCNSGKKFFVTYTNQVVINSSGFSAGGDSGSLIMTSDTAQPIALLYAGSSSSTIGNRISDVLSALGTELGSPVSFVGAGTHAVTCPSQGGGGPRPHAAASAVGLQRAIEAKDRHASQLMADPTVLGVGVGADEETGEALIMIYVEQGRAHGPIPSQLDGVRTQVIRTDLFRAYGWNEPERPAPQACSAR